MMFYCKILEAINRLSGPSLYFLASIFAAYVIHVVEYPVYTLMVIRAGESPYLYLPVSLHFSVCVTEIAKFTQFIQIT